MYRNVAISWSIEFGPIIVFFVSLAVLGSSEEGFVFSTGLFTAATALTLFVAYTRERRIALFPLIAGLSVILFGLATVWLKNPLIFILKDTIYNGAFAIFLLVGALMGKGWLKPLFAPLFDMQERGWYILSVRWCIVFFLLALSNEYFWRHYSNAVWVQYKFWSTVATTVFGLYQIRLSRAFRNEAATPWGMRMRRIGE